MPVCEAWMVLDLIISSWTNYLRDNYFPGNPSWCAEQLWLGSSSWCSSCLIRGITWFSCSSPSHWLWWNMDIRWWKKIILSGSSGWYFRIFFLNGGAMFELNMFGLLPHHLSFQNSSIWPINGLGRSRYLTGTGSLLSSSYVGCWLAVDMMSILGDFVGNIICLLLQTLHG